MADDDLRRRIERLEARNDIDELVSAYCMACDDRDLDRLRGLFTADVRIRSRDGAMDARGADAAMAMFERMFAIRGPSFHWTHDHSIRITGADSATGLIMAHAETTPNGTVSLAAIRYNDVYRRENGAWKIAQRELSFLYYLPAADYGEGLTSPLRIRVHGTPQPADYPETLATWPR